MFFGILFSKCHVRQANRLAIPGLAELLANKLDNSFRILSDVEFYRYQETIDHTIC